MPKLNRHKRRWTADDDNYLRANCDLPLRRQASALGRTMLAVAWRRNALDLTPFLVKPSKDAVRALAEKWAPVARCTVDEIMAPDRRSHVAWARHQVIRELRQRGHSGPAIGGALGMDHSSVYYALSRGLVDLPCPWNKKNPPPVSAVTLPVAPPPPPPPAPVIRFPRRAHPAVIEPSSIAPISKARLMGGR